MLKDFDKEINDWESALFEKVVGIPLKTEPVNGKVIASEKGLENELYEFEKLKELFEPIIHTLLHRTRTQERERCLEIINHSIDKDDAYKEILSLSKTKPKEDKEI